MIIINCRSVTGSKTVTEAPPIMLGTNATGWMAEVAPATLPLPPPPPVLPPKKPEMYE